MKAEHQYCHDCHVAANILRRLGFRDSISWGPLSGPNLVFHGFHANSGDVEIAEYRRILDIVEGKERWTERRSVVASIPEAREDGVRYVSERSSRRPLCGAYRSELSWLLAGRPMYTMVYMAHPVSGNFAENIENAFSWLRFLRSRTPHQLFELTGVEYDRKPIIHAPWLAVADATLDADPNLRESIIAECKATAMLFSEVWHVGGRISSGMADEASVVPVARNLTHLGFRHPGWEAPAYRKHLSLPEALDSQSGPDAKPRKYGLGPIPPGVYYNIASDNFYDIEKHKGMGTMFYDRWQHRRAEFPQASRDSNGHPIIRTRPEYVRRKSKKPAKRKR